MIIKGKSRAGPSALAAHLGNAEKNERIALLETKGTVAQDLRGALIEMDAYASGTRCEKSLYHAAISPEPPHRLSQEQRAEAVNALEEKLGLNGHARVVVMHEKLGRQHLHVVWSRIDLDQMKSVSDSHNYRKHEEVSRDLERRFGHEKIRGALAERDGAGRPRRTPSRAELRQEERTGIKGDEVRATLTAAFKKSRDAEHFKRQIEEQNLVLAKGDRRDFVVVDRAGGIHSLARRIDGIRAADLREFMDIIDRETLPTAEEARQTALERERERRGSREEALTQANYSKGDDYVSQTQAALKDHERRQERLNNDDPRPQQPEVRATDDDDRRQQQYVEQKQDDDHHRREAEEAARRNQNETTVGEGDRTVERRGATEMTDAQRERMHRMLASEKKDRKHDDTLDDTERDRQHEAPGGGHTRSR
ncbi:MAG: relaxase/mobilization nuclease domain-containing protein [Alphaproteobacteria bacterium]|nr:relaxase/mobilization nuclease domain-containing protein [Alphaproteobacteria bacterium]